MSKLLPREHGAYFELLLPMATVWLGLGLNWGAAVWSVIPIVGFLAHEPVLVAVGRRGARVQRTLAGEARRRLLLLGCIGAGSVVGAATFTGDLVWRTVAGPSALALVGMLFLWKGKEKTLIGEVIVAVALTAWCFPVATAVGAELFRGFALWMVWGTAFTLSTLAVHAMKSRHGRRRRPFVEVLCPILALTALGAALAFWMGGGAGGAAALWVMPIAIGAFFLALVRPHPRHLRRVGWGLAAMATLTLVGLVWTLRTTP